MKKKTGFKTPSAFVRAEEFLRDGRVWQGPWRGVYTAATRGSGEARGDRSFLLDFEHLHLAEDDLDT